ncbi:MAG: hypothetical protein HON90_13310 [Halobacteriovoraceae bacterium]|nr:hypothetical protein [Halobacteriovoraceae bacterium]
MKLHKKVLLGLTIGLSFQSVMAQKFSKYPKVYPFVPKPVSEIYKDVEHISEDKEFIKNFDEIMRQKLSKARTKVKPWTSSYWPLAKGTLADAYTGDSLSYFVDLGWIDWKSNHRGLKRRFKKTLKNVDKMTEHELSRLAPSEKYDILVGDKNFGLTRKLQQYMKDWGSKKLNAFITDLRIVDEDALLLAEKYVSWGWFKTVDEAFADNYEHQGSLSVENALALVKIGKYDNVTDAFYEAVDMAKEQAPDWKLGKQSKLMAAWEGICNGWSTAAGNIPRPRKAISFELPNGKNLEFYPADIKGLTALFWVNSVIQNAVQRDANGDVKSGGTLMVGKRCNIKAEKDQWGRPYDHKADPFNYDHTNRCAGVHPATWHLGLVNLIGKQGRSFVVERKVGPAVDNHPMYKYKMNYFNPNTGDYHYSNMAANIVEADEKDQFRKMRNPKTKYIVGVEAEFTYLNYATPKRKTKDSEKDDDDVDHAMMYDLELDADYNIIGGQWRAVTKGEPWPLPTEDDEEVVNNQPDFFWAITKDWKETGLFDDQAGLETWEDKTKAPPVSWKKASDSSIGYVFYEAYKYNSGQKCNMTNKKTGKKRAVTCEKAINKPQPLSNILNVMIDRAKK